MTPRGKNSHQRRLFLVSVDSQRPKYLFEIKFEVIRRLWITFKSLDSVWGHNGPPQLVTSFQSSVGIGLKLSLEMRLRKLHQDIVRPNAFFDQKAILYTAPRNFCTQPNSISHHSKSIYIYSKLTQQRPLVVQFQTFEDSLTP